MFSKFSSKLSSFKSSMTKTPATGNNSIQQLTGQEPVPKSTTKQISEETEMASFDGASMKRNQSFNSYTNISDTEFNDDDLSEKSEKSNTSSYNMEYINSLNNFSFNTDGSTTPSKKSDDNSGAISTPNKPLPLLPNQINNNNQTPQKESNIITNTTATQTNSSTPLSSNKQFFGGHRFDFKLKPNGILSFSDYSSVPIAHKSYWESKDVIYFISERLSSNKHTII
ncbi:hypothetical protein DICPUDRAFT_92366 [Dictyostelium purpureum]|uniref:DDHD domain-containing protein n=1 Tax=Dictyostelium purpureum TaxID=5786 RepID=F0ZQQ9_DICPU|nr:uncharacterized protein DICPUDRAFT_92366 [Dictyostelium purpureum]EGC33710.1 hypothetical protein DICPUDRAFT_92366 [Dictyostelium purpureum]|eukprot:XP_003289749.1 hypothetical protein DICPUDRAFT_92366 [Dictyostelium purpureum]